MTSQAAFGPPFFPWGRTPFKKGASPLFFLTLLLAGCATERAYDGPPLPTAERAIVSADTALSAGLPVQLRLRQADGRDLPLTANSVELPPGMHVLLVDCRVTESGATQRFTVEAELEPGAEYRLVAIASARNCEAVTLQRR